MNNKSYKIAVEITSYIFSIALTVFLAALFDWSAIVWIPFFMVSWLFFYCLGEIQMEEQEKKDSIAEAAKLYLERNK